MPPPSTESTESNGRARRAGAHRPRILVVEDDGEFAAIVRFGLETGGYEVDVTSSVTEALRRMRVDGELDLVISDVRLEGESGIALLFPEAYEEALPPVLMMSGFLSPGLQRFVEGMGATVLEKPFSFGRLHASVIGALSKTRRAREQRMAASSSRLGLD